MTFTLLSDTDKLVAKRYGVKGLLMPDRVTFLIDENGRIVRIIRDIDVSEHAQQILDGFN